MKLVACRLKGGVSTCWERLQNRRLREGKQSIRMWYLFLAIPKVSSRS